MMKRFKPGRPPAFALFELLAVLIVVGVMLGAIVGAVVSVQKAFAAQIQRSAVDEAWAELSEKIRDDLRSTRSIVWVGQETGGAAGSALRLAMTLDDGREIEYRSDVVLPVVTRPDNFATPRPPPPTPAKRTPRRQKQMVVPAQDAPIPQGPAVPSDPEAVAAALRNPDSAFRIFARHEKKNVTLHKRGFDLVRVQTANGKDLWDLNDVAKNKPVPANEAKFLLLTFEYRQPGGVTRQFQAGAAMRSEKTP